MQEITNKYFSLLLLCFSPVFLISQSLERFVARTPTALSTSSSIKLSSSLLSINESNKGLYVLTQREGCFLINQKYKNRASAIVEPVNNRDYFHSLVVNGKEILLWANEKELITLKNKDGERLSFSTSFFSKTVDSKNIVIDPVGNVYIGTASDGLFIFERDENGVYRDVPKRISMIDEQLPSNNIQCLYKDIDGTIWIGTDAGIASVKEGRVHNYSKVTITHHQWSSLLGVTTKTCPFSQSIYAISNWGNNSLLLAGDRDLYRINLKNDSIKNIYQYHLFSKLENPLTNIQALMVDIDGNVWIAANQLIRYNITTDKVAILSDIYNFKSQGFLSLHEDLKGRKVWVGTNRGGLYHLKY